MHESLFLPKSNRIQAFPLTPHVLQTPAVVELHASKAIENCDYFFRLFSIVSTWHVDCCVLNEANNNCSIFLWLAKTSTRCEWWKVAWQWACSECHDLRNGRDYQIAFTRMCLTAITIFRLRFHRVILDTPSVAEGIDNKHVYCIDLQYSNIIQSTNNTKSTIMV